MGRASSPNIRTIWVTGVWHGWRELWRWEGREGGGAREGEKEGGGGHWRRGGVQMLTLPLSTPLSLSRGSAAGSSIGKGGVGRHPDFATWDPPRDQSEAGQGHGGTCSKVEIVARWGRKFRRRLCGTTCRSAVCSVQRETAPVVGDCRLMWYYIYSLPWLCVVTIEDKDIIQTHTLSEAPALIWHWPDTQLEPLDNPLCRVWVSCVQSAVLIFCDSL